MQKIPLELATPEMVLAKSIKRQDGSLMAAEGEVLTEAQLKRLSLGGITHLIVRDKPVPGYGMGYDVAGRRSRVEYLFRNHKNSIFMKTVCAFLVKHFEERL